MIDPLVDVSLPSARPRRSRGTYAKSAGTKHRIVAAAWEVIAENGFSQAATADIARRAGISAAQVFYYFPTKVDILYAVLEERDRIAGEIAGDGPKEPREVPDAFLRIARSNESIPSIVSLYTVLAAESTIQEHPAASHFRVRYQ